MVVVSGQLTLADSRIPVRLQGDKKVTALAHADRLEIIVCGSRRGVMDRGAETPVRLPAGEEIIQASLVTIRKN
jgi:hypothetical protein